MKRFTLPRASKYTPLLWIISGGVLLFWLSLEDRNMLGVTLLGIGTAILVVAHFLLRQYGGHALSLIWLPVFSAMCGAVAALNTTLLMFFKTAWHAHPFPDYPPQMMLDMLSRLPAWGIAGGFAGLGVALLWYAFMREIEAEET